VAGPVLLKASNISETKQFEKIFLFSFCFFSADAIIHY